MRSDFRKALFCLILLFAALLPVAASARPAPPPQLMGMLKELDGFEEAIEKKQWQQAAAEVETTSESFARLRPVLEKERPKETAAAERKLKQLQEAVAQKKFERVYTCYVELQQMIISLMDAFDYKVHPSLFLIEVFINEAREGGREGNLEKVENELREIESLYGAAARPHLEQRGAAPVVTGRFADKVQEVRQAAAEKRLTEATAGLEELHNLFTMLSRGFGSR